MAPKAVLTEIPTHFPIFNIERMFRPMAGIVALVMRCLRYIPTRNEMGNVHNPAQNALLLYRYYNRWVRNMVMLDSGDDQDGFGHRRDGDKWCTAPFLVYRFTRLSGRYKITLVVPEIYGNYRFSNFALPPFWMPIVKFHKGRYKHVTIISRLPRAMNDIPRRPHLKYLIPP